MKNKGSSRFFAVIGCISLFIFILIASILSIAFDINHYENEYLRLGNAEKMGMNDEQLIFVTNHMLNYLSGKTDEFQITATVYGQKINMFSDRAVEHMVDVKKLFQTANTAMYIFAGAAVLSILLAVVLRKKKSLHLLAKTYLITTVVLLVVVGAMTAFIMLDFDRFWNAFHRVFFTNDLWMLDSSDNLLNMVPASFFSSTCMKIIYRVLSVLGAIALACVLELIIHGARKRNKEFMQDVS